MAQEFVPGTQIVRPKLSNFGTDGNSFALMAQVSSALKRAKIPSEIISAFQKEAMSSDYDHLLMTCGKYVDIAPTLMRMAEPEYNEELDDESDYDDNDYDD